MRLPLLGALLLALVLSNQPSVAADDTGGSGGATSPVARLLSHRITDPRIGSDVSMIVVDARTGQVIWSRRPDRGMQAASNMKLVTATTTLARFRPTRRFATRLVRGQNAHALIIQGGGDPLLSRKDLRHLAERAVAVLGRKGSYTVAVDASLFAKATKAPGWVDAYLGNSVGMVQALAIHGDRSRTPSRHAAEYFVSQLRRLGLRAHLVGSARARPGAALVADVKGHTVASDIAHMLSQSDSSIAEVLFRQVALATGTKPTWAGSTRAARQTLSELGIDTSGLVLADGSGLSRKDRISPSFLARLLQVIRFEQRERFKAIFAPRALPVAGRSGTLATRFGRYISAPSRCAKGKVRAKTGTILGTIALTGVANSPYGPRIFSVIVNHRPQRYSALETRRALDGLAATVVGCWR